MLPTYKKQHRVLRTFGLTLLATVLYVSQSHADTTATQTWDVTASCLSSQFLPCFDAASISAVITTQLEQGTFYNAFTDSSFTGTAPVVTSISGTFDGQAMTLVPAGWMQGELPQDVEFIVGASEYDIYYDGAFYLQPEPQSQPPEFIAWNAVDPAATPEYGTFTLVLTGVWMVLVLTWIRRSARG